MSERAAGFELERLRGLVTSGPAPLFATISGAHLYGFPSPDSDVDLRGAFVAPLREIVGLREVDETLTLMRTDDDGLEIDWVAHDVRKFCGLLRKRNGYVLEQLFSPLVVWGGPWLEELRALGEGCVVKQLFFHYRGFFANQRKELEKADPTVKALLYAYRVALSGIHVLRTGRVEADLPTLCEALADVLPDGSWAKELIARKSAGAEKGALHEADLARVGGVLDQLEAALTEAHDASRLPEDYPPVDGLHDYVVRARLELGQ